MRWKTPAGVMLAVALLIPAAPAMAQNGTTKTAAATCQTVAYVDIRTLVPADLDAATDTQVRIAGDQILSAATTEALTYLPGRVQQALDGTSVDLRAFLKTGVQPVWMTDLRIAANQSLYKGGPNVRTAAQAALDTGTIDGFLTYFNDGQYIARAMDAGSFKAYADIRTLVPADLDAATDTQVRIAGDQILSAATTEALTYLPGRVQQALDGTSVDLRAFLKTGVQPVWMTDLRIAANQVLYKGGPNVQTAAQAALDTGTIDGFLAFFNHERYRAGARDCAL